MPAQLAAYPVGMFIAHLPAGYLLSRSLGQRLPAAPLLIGSICPDFDLSVVWLGLAQGNHHGFLTHRPAVWLALVMVAWLGKSRSVLALAVGALLHLCLDSVTGSIDWAWPFGSYVLGLTNWQSDPSWWPWSYLVTPKFMIELTICATALSFWLKRKDPRPLGRGSV